MKKPDQEKRFLSGVMSCISLSLLIALALFHPAIQQFDDGLFHALRCIGPREVFPDLVHRQSQVPVLRFLLLHHNAQHGIVCEPSGISLIVSFMCASILSSVYLMNCTKSMILSVITYRIAICALHLFCKCDTT